MENESLTMMKSFCKMKRCKFAWILCGSFFCFWQNMERNFYIYHHQLYFLMKTSLIVLRVAVSGRVIASNKIHIIGLDNDATSELFDCDWIRAAKQTTISVLFVTSQSIGWYIIPSFAWWQTCNRIIAPSFHGQITQANLFILWTISQQKAISSDARTILYWLTLRIKINYCK